MLTFCPFPTARRTGSATSLRMAVCICLLGVSGVRADELSEVQGLYRTGQSVAAMARADLALANKPDDPQMRFLKGVMLADAKRSDEAAAVFLKLTEDHPDLVEPYNNLAAIYAARGDYPKARATLEVALRTRPGFALAQENLGDVYVALAAEAYARALTLEPVNSGIAPKLALVRQLMSSKSDPVLK